MAGGAADFLRLMNEQNDRIAAREAEETTQREADLDRFRLQRDAERRERLGQLRARPHQGKRPKRARLNWDTIDINV